MCFSIDTGQPGIIGGQVATYRDCSEAIEDMFEWPTNEAYIVFGEYTIQVMYKYDLCVMIDDIIDMIHQLDVRNSGNCNIEFGSSSFRTGWELSWNEDDLGITAHWESIVCNPKDLVGKTTNISVSKMLFIKEWLKILQVIKSAFDQNQFIVEDGIPADIECILEKYQSN